MTRQLFSLTDVIYGHFECGNGPTSRYVRYSSTPGGGRAFLGCDGDPVPSHWPLVDWRYATSQEIDDFETNELECALEALGPLKPAVIPHPVLFTRLKQASWHAASVRRFA